jgi:hypothetical protein
VGYNRYEISKAVHQHLCNGKVSGDFLYGDGHAGKRISDLLCSVPLHVEKQLTY